MAIVEKTKQSWDKGVVWALALFFAQIVLWAAAFAASYAADGAGGYWLAVPACLALFLALCGTVVAVKAVIRRAEPFWLGVALAALEVLMTVMPVLLYVSGLREVLA